MLGFVSKKQKKLERENTSGVVFRGWDRSHSIRSEILLRYWCPDFFQLLQKIFFFDRSKKKFGNFQKFSKKWKFSFFFKNFSRDFQKVENFQRKSLLFSLKIFDFLRIFNFFENFRLFSNFFFDRSKKYFLEELKKKIRTSRSK